MKLTCKITPRVAFHALLLIAVFAPGVASAQTLTVSPLAWNVIGLDSNLPTSGPKNFPVGARICSSVATTNVDVNFF
ncbi:MAG: hypothetical protein HYU52_05350 [Acidobacteria bacterium]|nr:hypothetical protein [Acidobacteriota bacterium]